MARQAMWVHGNSAQIEFNKHGRGGGEDLDGLAWTALVGQRFGGGVVFRCQKDSDYWFHFAIPTPAIHDGARARLRRGGLLFNSEKGVTLNSIQVWDGPNQVFTKDGLKVEGDNRSILDGDNWFALPDEEVFWGVGVSVLFHFAKAANITLFTAGVEFES